MTDQTLWRTIAETLRAEIAGSVRAPGERLPTETQLSARFGVNRHTVRRALAALAEEGLVHARRGAGVFVAARPTEYRLGKRVRFHRNLETAGRLPGKRFTLIETRRATAAEAAALDLPEGSEVHAAEGVSLSDGRPIAVFLSVFPAARLPGMAVALGRVSSVTEALRACGVADYVRRETRLTAVLADPVQAALLELPAGAPLLRSESVNVDPAGRPVERGVTFFAGERVTLSVDHS